MKQVSIILTMFVVITSCGIINDEPSTQEINNLLKKYEGKSHLNHDSTELEFEKLDSLIKMLDQTTVNTIDTVKKIINIDDSLKKMNYYLDSNELDLKSILFPTSKPSQYH